MRLYCMTWDPTRLRVEKALASEACGAAFDHKKTVETSCITNQIRTSPESHCKHRIGRGNAPPHLPIMPTFSKPS